jgi:uncharacterized protein (DUF2141 family)
MKLFLISFLLFYNGISTLTAQENKTLTITLEITTTKYNKGHVLLALYDSEKNYMKEIFRSAEVPIKNNKAKIIFNLLEKGEYAFSFFQDLNENKKIDTNFLGIPKEPYGFSNQKKGRFGPPKFKEVAFKLNKNDVFKIVIE